MTAQRYNGIRRQLRRRQAVAGGFTMVPDGFEVGDVKVEIDVDAIAKRLGLQALGNRSGVSKFLHGLIVVTVLNRSRVKE